MEDTRDRLLIGTAELLRRGGFHGTSLKQITAAANAPTGSLYHFFPGGKDELVEAVVTTSGAAYLELFELIAADKPDPPSAVAAFFDGAADVMAATDFIDICPIGTLAREIASTHPSLRAASDDVFSSWVAAASELFQRAGLSPLEADDLATTLVATLEGGFLLARTRRDAEPLRAAGRVMRSLIEDRLGRSDAT